MVGIHFVKVLENFVSGYLMKFCSNLDKVDGLLVVQYSLYDLGVS